jgi:ParB family chromosome partitioning protein
VAAKGLSVRDTERLVQHAAAATKSTGRHAARLDADSRRLQEELSESLGATVRLKPRRGGKGSLVIDYASLDELQGLLKKLKRA